MRLVTLGVLVGCFCLDPIGSVQAASWTSAKFPGEQSRSQFKGVSIIRRRLAIGSSSVATIPDRHLAGISRSPNQTLREISSWSSTKIHLRCRWRDRSNRFRCQLAL
jgi:hypothetical protein